MRDWWILGPLLLSQAALPFGLLMMLPGLSFLPVALMALLVLRHWRGIGAARRWAAAGGVAAWVAYAAYETRMYYWMLTVIAPIRVDMLVLIPLLWLATCVVVLAARPRPF